MAVTSTKYTRSNYNAYAGNISDLTAVGTTINVALMTDAFVFNKDTDDNWGDVLLNEIDPATNPPYVAGGQTIANPTFNIVGSLAVFDGDNVSWASADITARYAVIYDATPAADADKKLIAVIDFEELKQTTNGTFELQWDASGIFAIEAL